jgi:hypothetical protein
MRPVNADVDETLAGALVPNNTQANRFQDMSMFMDVANRHANTISAGSDSSTVTNGAAVAEEDADYGAAKIQKAFDDAFTIRLSKALSDLATCCDDLWTKGDISNRVLACHQIMTSLEIAFQRAVPMPARSTSDCPECWRAKPSTREKLDVLRSLKACMDHYTAASMAIHLDREMDSHRWLTCAAILAVFDGVLRLPSPENNLPLSRVLRGEVDDLERAFSTSTLFKLPLATVLSIGMSTPDMLQARADILRYFNALPGGGAHAGDKSEDNNIFSFMAWGASDSGNEEEGKRMRHEVETAFIIKTDGTIKPYGGNSSVLDLLLKARNLDDLNKKENHATRPVRPHLFFSRLSTPPFPLLTTLVSLNLIATKGLYSRSGCKLHTSNG